MRATFRDLFAYARRYPRAYLTGLTLLVTFAALTTFAPVLVGRVIDTLQAAGDGGPDAAGEDSDGDVHRGRPEQRVE